MNSLVRATEKGRERQGCNAARYSRIGRDLVRGFISLLQHFRGASYSSTASAARNRSRGPLQGYLTRMARAYAPSLTARAACGNANDNGGWGGSTARSLNSEAADRSRPDCVPAATGARTESIRARSPCRHERGRGPRTNWVARGRRARPPLVTPQMG